MRYGALKKVKELKLKEALKMRVASASPPPWLLACGPCLADREGSYCHERPDLSQKPGKVQRLAFKGDVLPDNGANGAQGAEITRSRKNCAARATKPQPRLVNLGIISDDVHGLGTVS